jgi:CDP-diacylglycerol---serine O-phosphatidyltransferase
MRGRQRGERRRAVVILPNGFTLANLFFGIFAIVTAARGDAERAAMYIVLGGVCDALDGRVARATGTGSRFGSELDSLVDAISFGLAPALLMYFATPKVLDRDGWDWIFVFLFTACAVIRLARFNIEQAGRAKKYFHGLPSPAAGMTLATYFWLRDTTLYQEAMVGLPWSVLLRYIMAGLAFLMISNVSYPAVPTIGYKKPSEIAGSLVVIGTIVGLIAVPKYFFFPALLAYVLYGVAKTAFFGLLGRQPIGDSPVIEDESMVFHTSRPEEEATTTVITERTEAVPARESRLRRRRRRRRHNPRGEGGEPRPNNEENS